MTTQGNPQENDLRTHLQTEIDRVKKLRDLYGKFASGKEKSNLMSTTILHANKALTEDNPERMQRMLQELKEFQE